MRPRIFIAVALSVFARYFAFGVPHEEVSEKAQPVWHEVGSECPSNKSRPDP